MQDSMGQTRHRHIEILPERVCGDLSGSSVPGGSDLPGVQGRYVHRNVFPLLSIKRTLTMNVPGEQDEK